MNVCTFLLASAFSFVFAFSPAASIGADRATDTSAEPEFTKTPAIDISSHHDFSDAKGINDDAASQLKGLCSFAEFRALPEADRLVYSFDPWPSASDDLKALSYAFNFHMVTAAGLTGEKISFTPTGGGPGGFQGLARFKEPGGSSYLLKGFGNLDWSGVSTHEFRFEKPVAAFGVVLKSSADVEIRKFFWQAAVERNGFPVSYTLADGTIVQLGERDVRGALLKAGSNAFIGVIDRSGCGIVSMTYTIRGLAGNKAQSVNLCDLVFAAIPKPAVAPVINLKSSCDFESPEAIAAAPSPAINGLTTLDAFRFIVGNHRYVYRFDTWPSGGGNSPANTKAFSFDLKGKGIAGQKVTLTAKNSGNDATIEQTERKDNESIPYHVITGLGDIGNGAWAEQTFTFEKPVMAFGVTYKSAGDVYLSKSAGAIKDFPITYTLSDGAIVNLGEAGANGGVIASNRKTFVGVMDDSDKGISSITFRIQGTAKAAQQIAIEDLAFAMAGPPPGDWKMTLNDQFDGDKLNPNIWSTGYKFVDVINNELQGFVPENVVVKDGLCTIKVEHRCCNNTDRFGKEGQAQKFASGAFTSVDKFTQTYGYFEARIKMPKARGAGVWPAFWMLPDRGKAYPDNIRYLYMGDSDKYGRGMEVDIFEFMPRWKTNEGLFPLHVGCIWSYGPANEKDPAPHGYGSFALNNDGWGPAELDFPHLDDQFHTYGLYWSPQRLIWFIDGKPIYRAKDPQHMPDVPHYFLFNISVHTNGWGKSPDKKDPTMADIIEDMPNQMQIDYFRAYSGTLEEVPPAAAGDIPGIVAKYSPPSDVNVPAPAPASSTKPAEPAKDTSAAPVNSQIATPSR
jgi:beta-glucanase (GH16 family)